MRTLLSVILCLFIGFLGGYYVGNRQIDTASTRQITPTLDKAGVDAKQYIQKETAKTTTQEIKDPAVK